MKVIIYAEIFWIVFASMILGAMALGALIKIATFTNMDFYIVIALVMRIGISIIWIKEEFREVRKK